MIDNSTILVTGGTGSFGRKFIRYLLTHYNPHKVIVFSRDEIKQWEMSKLYQDEKRIRFFIGDVRDKDRLRLAINQVDYVIHAAATKIIPTAEYDPFECIKTNINGAMNLIEVCLEKSVQRVIALSTDKACSPINLYGATKLASDKLFVAANSYSGGQQTAFSIVRYGNVMGSRGSVIPFFYSIKDQPLMPITHSDMTRFMMTLEESVELVEFVLKNMLGGEIFVKKIPSMKVVDIAKVIAPNAEHKIMGVRAGEKIHEQMINIEDARYTYEYDNYFKILPSLFEKFKDQEMIGSGKKVSKDFAYGSQTNNQWLDPEILQKWLQNNQELLRPEPRL